jgi:hypothetical protein
MLTSAEDRWEEPSQDQGLLELEGGDSHRLGPSFFRVMVENYKTLQWENAIFFCSKWTPGN